MVGLQLLSDKRNPLWALSCVFARQETWGLRGDVPKPCWKTTVLA